MVKFILTVGKLRQQVASLKVITTYYQDFNEHWYKQVYTNTIITIAIDVIKIKYFKQIIYIYNHIFL